MTKTSTLNPAAAAVLAQIKTGSDIRRIGPNGSDVTVSEISDKSVHFSNGKRTDKRSLHHYAVVAR
jgi:restriction endonuclease